METMEGAVRYQMRFRISVARVRTDEDLHHSNSIEPRRSCVAALPAAFSGREVGGGPAAPATGGGGDVRASR